MSEEQARILSDKGISEVKPMARPTLRIKVHHAIFGCTLVKHLVLNQAIGGVVEVGRICPICLKEYPIG